MNRKIKIISPLLISIMAISASHAGNKPCSGKKGGIDHCENGRFICKDGSVSQSKKKCGSEDKQTKEKTKDNSKKK